MRYRAISYLAALFTFLILGFGLVRLAHAATVCQIFNGCTGTSTLPATGDLLIGGKNGEYEFVASSTLGGSSPITSVFGRTGAITAQTGDYTTSQIPEGTNLYYTSPRADADFVISLAGTTSISSITTLPNLSLPYGQLTGAPSIPSFPLSVTNGGTGSTTLTGILKGNGTGGIQTAIGDSDYQKPISLTTTGSSGAATFSGDMLNIPQYSGIPFPFNPQSWGNSTSTVIGLLNGLLDTASSTFTGNVTFANPVDTSNGYIYGTAGFSGGEYLYLTNPVTLLNGNNGWGINLESDYTRLVGGGEGKTELEWSTDTGLSRLSAGVLALGNGTYQDTSGGLIAASSTLANLTVGTLSGFVGATNGLLYAIASSSADLPNSALQNSSVTINGTNIALGGSGTISTASSTLLGDSNTFSGANNFSSTFEIGGTTFSLPVSVANGGTNTTSQTTNGVAYFDGAKLTTGTGLTYSGTTLSNAGFINTNQYGGYKQNGNTVLYASTTNTSLAVGSSAAAGWLSATSSAFYDVAIGQGALGIAPTSGAALANIAIGYDTLDAITSGSHNVALGFNALTAATSTMNNVAIGFDALLDSSYGTGQNVALGTQAMELDTFGADNFALGYQSLLNNTTGLGNVCIGADSCQQNQTGGSNIAIGTNAFGGVSGNSASDETFIGYATGFGVTTGGYNTFLGYQAGYKVTTGADNILIGAASTTANSNLTTGNDNILIGDNISFQNAAGSDQLDIGNLLFGTLGSAGTTVAKGGLGIASTTFNGVLGLGTGASTNGTSTISAGKIQIDGYNSAGSRVCMFVVGTTLTIISGQCNQ